MKYARIEQNTLIVVPTEEGSKGYFTQLKDGVDKIAGVEVKARIHKFEGMTIKNFQVKMIDPKNLITIRVYTSTGQEFNMAEDMFVEVEEPKAKVEPKKEEVKK